MQNASDIFRGMLRLACVIALVMVGFAHKPVSAYPADAQRPAYALPDGTFASICIADHDSKPHDLKDYGCEACRLSSAIVAPMPPCVSGSAIAFAADVPASAPRLRIAKALYPPNSGPRAPPLSSSMFA